MASITTRAGKGSPLTNAEMDANLNNMNAAIGGVITTIASATTPDVFVVTSGPVIDYTGTATCTGFVAAPQAGATRTLICAGAAVFTAGANMLIDGVGSGSNFTAAANDEITVIAVTTTQFRLRIQKYAGYAVIGANADITSMTALTGITGDPTITGTLKVSTGAAVGGATAGTGGLAFPATAVAVADANTLDDYEEGTWTATVAAGSISSQNCTYTKVGRAVHIRGDVTYGGTTETPDLGGLPFTAANTGDTAVAIYANGLDSASAATAVMAFITKNTANIPVYGFALNSLASMRQSGATINFSATYFI